MSRLITMGAVLMLAACPLGTAHSQTQTSTVPNVRSIEVLYQLDDRSGSRPDGQLRELLAFHEGSGIGGGIYRWDKNIDKRNHNGGTVIDPSQDYQQNIDNVSVVGNQQDGVWTRVADEEGGTITDIDENNLNVSNIKGTVQRMEFIELDGTNYEAQVHEVHVTDDVIVADNDSARLENRLNRLGELDPDDEARQLSSIIVINSNNVSINRNSVGNNEVGGPQDWGIGIVNSTNVVMRSNSYENLPPINGNLSLPQNHYATSTSEVERINDPAN